MLNYFRRVEKVNKRKSLLNADGALIAKRDYGYDALDRVVSRVQTRGTGESTTTRTDAFGNNSRSELTSAMLGNAAYAYAFDYIGNRETASEAGTPLAYTANALVVSIVSINFSYLPHDCGFAQFIFERKEPVETFFEKYPL